MSPSTEDLDDILKKLAYSAYERIILMIYEGSEYKLEIGREYLPEICNEAILEFSNNGFPMLKPFTLRLFSSQGLKTDIFEKRVRFSLPGLIKRANMEKISEKRKKFREKREREVRARLIKSLQGSRKAE